MAFKIKKNKTFNVQIHTKQFDETGTEVESEQFTAVFTKKSKKQHDDYMAKSKEDNKNRMDILRENMIGWSGVVDEKGEELAFTKDSLEQLIELDQTVAENMVNEYILYYLKQIQLFP